MRTPYGLMRIGYRKRVIEIDWSDTDIRGLVTDDAVTKTVTLVHAWSDEDVIKYLKEWKNLAEGEKV